MHNSFRTKEGNAQYDAYRATGVLEKSCVLCERESLHEFTLWRIIENRFPYDRIASVHHMLVPKRHTSEGELTDDERRELYEIKQNSLEEYQFIIEPTPHVKSIPAHFHLHLVVSKEIN